MKIRASLIYVTLVLLAVGAVFSVDFLSRGSSKDIRTSYGQQVETQRTGLKSGDALIKDLFRSRASGVMVESIGVVKTFLRDDLDGSRHQRFIVRLQSGHTLLVSHNIDIAPRIEDIEISDMIEFRGQYEWNNKGGLIHWTHHDSKDQHPGGWIRHDGKFYE